jgi:hypothetical protein
MLNGVHMKMGGMEWVGCKPTSKALQERIMRAAQVQRQTVERADVFAWMCVVVPVGA